MSELKPCPFCGNRPTPFDGDHRMDHAEDCLLKELGLTWIVGRRKEAKWNRRAPNPLLPLVKVLREALNDEHWTYSNMTGGHKFKSEHCVVCQIIARADKALSESSTKMEEEGR